MMFLPYQLCKICISGSTKYFEGKNLINSNQFLGHYPSAMRMMMQHHPALSENKDNITNHGNVVVKRRSSEEQGGPGGKFKFKDSIRERFSHEAFEGKPATENATVTSDHFTGSTMAKMSSTHQEFYSRRRRPSRSCDDYGEDVNSGTSQVCNLNLVFLIFN